MSESDPAAEYRRRRAARQEAVAAADRRSAMLSYARVAAFLFAAAAVWAVATHRAPGILIAVPVVLFVLLVGVHDRAERARRRALRAVDYWDRGLQRIEERWVGHGEGGARFYDDAHPYARDLDLFGKGSLFELLCTARTRSGEETLARMLLVPAAADEARARQAAVQELRTRLDLREALALAGEDVRAEVDPAGLSRWGAAAPVLVRGAAWLVVGLLSLAGTVVIAGWFAQRWNALPVAVAVPIVGLVMRAYRDRVHAVHAGVDRPGRDLAVLALVTGLFEKEQFACERLRALGDRLRHGDEPASQQIAGLARLVDWANAQRNQFFAPIGWLVLWPVHFAYAIEGWRARSGADVARWIDVIGEMEALCAVAGYAYERPDEPFPTIVSDGPRVEATGLGHPLIPRDKCVRNDITFGGALRLYVVSGSNMSGKSTMLRTLGINVVLALAGAPVRATTMTLCPLQVGATLRIQDSLAEGASRFYAEITRLKQLVDLSRAEPPLLFLIDEILAGTNSHDRRIGAEAVVRGLLDHGAIGLVTTHDLALAEVASALGPRARNVHFEDRMVDGKLQFDYRMRDGVVEHSNAIALMRAVGLNLTPMRARRIDAAEVDAAWAIVAACGRALAAAGHRNWDPPIAVDKMRAQATSRQIYLVTDDDSDAPVATYTVTTEPPHAYPPDVFAPGVPALYLNRLAVLPERWRGGLGRACMDDVESRARAAGCRVVRFDVFRDNPSVHDFYRRLGYVNRGPFVVEEVIPVICYEKELAP